MAVILPESAFQLCRHLGGFLLCFLEGRPPKGLLLIYVQPGWEAAWHLSLPPGDLGAPGGTARSYQDLLSLGRMSPPASPLDLSSSSALPPEEATAPLPRQPAPASGLLKRLIPSFCGCSLRPLSPHLQLFALQLIKCGCLLSEDKVGYLLHLGAPECQRHTQLEKILAGISRAYVCRVQGRRASCSHLGDLQSFQIWLQLIALHHQEPDAVYLGSSGRAAGRSIIRINILVPKTVSLEGIQDAIKIYTNPPYVSWCDRPAHVAECPGQAPVKEMCPHPVPFSEPLLGPWHSIFTFLLEHCKAAWLMVIFFFMEGGIWMCSFYRFFFPLNNNALKMFDICN